MHAMNSPGVAGPVVVYIALALKLQAPAPVYQTPAPPAVDPSGMFDPMVKLLDGRGGDFGGILYSLARL